MFKLDLENAEEPGIKLPTSIGSSKKKIYSAIWERLVCFVVWCFSPVALCVPMDCSTPGLLSFTFSQRLLKLMSIESVMPSSYSSSVVPFSSCLQPFPASGSFPMNQFFASGGQNIYWSFSYSISPSSEYSGLISFRIDWFDLLAVQGTLKSLLQHHSSKTSILQCSAFFIVQLSHPYMTMGKP